MCLGKLLQSSKRGAYKTLSHLTRLTQDGTTYDKSHGFILWSDFKVNIRTDEMRQCAICIGHKADNLKIPWIKVNLSQNTILARKHLILDIFGMLYHEDLTPKAYCPFSRKHYGCEDIMFSPFSPIYVLCSGVECYKDQQSLYNIKLTFLCSDFSGLSEIMGFLYLKSLPKFP